MFEFNEAAVGVAKIGGPAPVVVARWIFDGHAHVLKVSDGLLDVRYGKGDVIFTRQLARARGVLLVNEKFDAGCFEDSNAAATMDGHHAEQFLIELGGAIDIVGEDGYFREAH